ncbi:MAG TPA: hypothetical protein VIZ29_00285 [Gaiellaceae bacterium]
MRRRWDIDERGRGVADARRLVPDAETLARFMSEEDWVTEEPDAHLLPHVRRVAAQFPLQETAAEIDREGVLAVSLRWTASWDQSAATAAAFALLGSFAEEMTYLRKDEKPGRVVLETVTGVVSEGGFAPHGHTVRIELAEG